MKRHHPNSGDGPDVHHHHHHHGHSHKHHHHHHQHHVTAAAEILRLLRGLESNELREGTIGFVLATLVHEDHIHGLMTPTLIASMGINHYSGEVETSKPVG